MINSPSSIMPVYKPVGIPLVYGKGVYLFDSSEKKYFDFYSGMGVNSLGHANQKIIKALNEQSQKLWHLSNLFPGDNLKNLSNMIVKNSFADKVFFCNSGAESVECSFKVARTYQIGTKNNTKKHKFISFRNAFHGRTLVASSASDPSKHSPLLGVPVPWFKNVELTETSVLEALHDGSICGVIIEPTQGEGGINVIPSEFLTFLRKVCDEHDIALIYDCVQCGMGRTGKFFDYQHSGVAPDICAVAKGIASGFPVGGCLSTEKFSQFMTVGVHGSTYGGNPLAMAVAYTVVTEILSDGFLPSVISVGDYLKSKLEQLKVRFNNSIVSIKGRGLMLGIEFKNSIDVNILAKKICHEGLLVVPASKSVIRIMPPLIIKSHEVDESTLILEKLLFKLLS